MGVAHALGVPSSRIGERLGGLPRPQHRGVVGRTDAGVVVIDDTYNSNPAGGAGGGGTPGGGGARTHRARHPRHGRAGPAPGRGEPGPGRLRRHPPVGHRDRGTHQPPRPAARAPGAGPPGCRTVARRPEAVAWVAANLGDGDGVLYENDLPDHYP